MGAAPSRSAVYTRAAMLATVGGMRTLMPWALLATAANRRGSPFLQEAPWPARLFRSRGALIGFGLVEVGELIGDQLPTTPSRLNPGPLSGRLVSGALSAAVLCLNAQRSPLAGLVVGAAAATGGAMAGYYTRAALGRATGLPDGVWGGVEDVIAVGLGILALRRHLTG